jgi:hypothetical protein
VIAVDQQTILAVVAAALVGGTGTGWAVLAHTTRKRPARARVVDQKRGRHRAPNQAEAPQVEAGPAPTIRAVAAVPTVGRRNVVPEHRYAWPAAGRG